MAVVDIFVETIAKLTSIKKKQGDKGYVLSPKISNNFSKTVSNVNDIFKYINIWDNQIDEMIAAKNYSFNTNESAIFIELRLGRSIPLLNKVTTYPEAVMVFHVFSQILDGGKDSMEQNLDIYRYRDIVKSNITGWSPSTCSNFMCFDDQLDYKHGNITKYLIGFNFQFNDFSGSIFDENSPNHLTLITKDGITLGSTSFFSDWVSGIFYEDQVSVIINGYVAIGASRVPNVYLCIEDNTDIIFDIAKWLLILSWFSEKVYAINDIIYTFNRVYKCNTANNDSIFNPTKWDIIT